MVGKETGQPVLIGIREMMAMTGLGRSTLDRMKAAAKLPKHVAVSCTLHRWYRQEILDWIAAGLPDQRTWEATKTARRQ